MTINKKILVLIISFYSFNLLGQFSSGGFNPPPPQQDTINDGSDTLDNSNSIFDIFTGKPGKAAFYSLIIPGGGQYYNKRYWKIPLVLGAEGGAIYWLLYNSNKLNIWQQGYLGLLNEEIPDFMGTSNIVAVKSIRDGYRKRKEYAYIVVIAAHLLNIFDAFIDRHLIDFDIDDNLGYNHNEHFKKWSQPTFGELSIKIPLQRKPEKSSRKIFSVY